MMVVLMAIGVRIAVWLGREDLIENALPPIACLLLPFVQGLLLARTLGLPVRFWRRVLGLAVIVMLVNTLAAAVFTRDGIVAVLPFTPQMSLALLVGVAASWLWSRHFLRALR